MLRGDLVALTGGTGFVGSHVAHALLAAGYRVRALARRPENPGWLKGTRAELVKGDVRDAATLPALIEGASAVVHVAGKTSARNDAEYMASNAAGSANVAAAVRKSAPGAHVVLVSSQAAGGPSLNGAPVRAADPPHPVSAYGRSKLAGEEAVRNEPGLAFTILRPSAVYGPRETAIRDLFVAASRGFVPVLAGGTQRIQMVYAGDAARAVLGALERGGRGETFFVAHPEVLEYRGDCRDAREPSLEASLARANPRGGDPGSGHPRRHLFDVRKGRSCIQRGEGKRAAPARVDLRRIRRTSGSGSAISNDSCGGSPAHLGVVSRARVDLGPRW